MIMDEISTTSYPIMQFLGFATIFRLPKYIPHDALIIPKFVFEQNVMCVINCGFVHDPGGSMHVVYSFSDYKCKRLW